MESAVDTSGVKVEYSCDADESSPAGEYQIDATVTDSNFDVEVEPGTLTVKKQKPVDPDPVVPDPDNPDNPDPDNPDPATRITLTRTTRIPTPILIIPTRTTLSPITRTSPNALR